MFILIPLILIFFAVAYLQVMEDISIYTEVFIYCFIVLVIFISFYTLRFIQNDMKKQELNNILLEINKLKQKLTNVKSEQQKLGIENEINILTDEYNKYIV